MFEEEDENEEDLKMRMRMSMRRITDKNEHSHGKKCPFFDVPKESGMSLAGIQVMLDKTDNS